ncbi:MAG: hypothetical protein ABS36_00555 [Acidobacteria bacterium SCN 69-37]|nr:MAG: hypothetical protein ABS36_00555 [Acidobacteria bacterium SCN 69-37]
MGIQVLSAHRRDPGPVVRRGSVVAVLLVLALVSGCATGRAVRSATTAEREADWDTAVTFYREALRRSPGRTDLRIKLERATRMASAEHVTRARQLEEQEQLPGAIAEYRLAADLDPSNVLAAQKAHELERRVREQIEAARPLPAVDALRAQATQSAIPRLDPRAPVPAMRFQNASVRDILGTIGQLTGININYDQGLEASLGRPYPIDVQEAPLEEVLNQVLQANTLTFKVQNARTIFVYQDTPQKRVQYEDRYLQNFYLSSANATQLAGQIGSLFGTTQVAVRPVVTPNDAANTISVVATAPVLAVIETFVRANDRAVPEVQIEAEILEVNRNFLRQIGLDLSQWAFGFAFSPEVGPGSAAGTLPPATPPPFNLNTISQGISAADFYATTPSALVRLLESNSSTRTLSKPSTRGSSGKQVTLTMGQDVPIPQTSFFSAGGNGVANIPTTSVTYQPVGVNLKFTPTVTYDDEIVLGDMILEKSGLGANIEVAGQSFPTIISRKASTSTRLRDGESTIIAGLLLDEDNTTTRSAPGLSNIPLIRNILGGTTSRNDQTDIVMIITPRIVRGHGLTADDVRPMYVGTGQNISTSPTPALLTPEALGIAPTTGGAAVPDAAPTVPAPTVPAPAGELVPASPNSPAAAIVPVTPAPAVPTSAVTRVLATPPSPGPSGGLLAGGGPYTMPIQVVGASDLATLSLTVTYDPSVVREPTVTPGSFMGQGGAQSSFVPGIDATAGRIDLAFARPTVGAGATGNGLLAAISFRAGEAGSTEIRITGVATTSKGLAIPIEFAATRITVQ